MLMFSKRNVFFVTILNYCLNVANKSTRFNVFSIYIYTLFLFPIAYVKNNISYMDFNSHPLKRTVSPKINYDSSPTWLNFNEEL